jgi:hypothetical protein
MALNEDLWRKLNSVACEAGSWMDAVKAASLRLLFPALDVRHSEVLVATTSTPVLGARRGCRRFLLLQNDSDEEMYISVDGTPAALNHGLFVCPKGNILLDITTTGLAVFAIHAGASGTKNLLVTEDVQ